MDDVYFTVEALNDLEQIERYIEQDSSANAKRFVQEIVARCRAINQTPFIGPQRRDLGPGLRIFGMRRRVAIIYHPEGAPDGRVAILRLLYGGQDLNAIFRGGGK